MPSDVETRDQETTAPVDLAGASRQMFEEAYNEGKFDLNDRLTAPDAVIHDSSVPADLRHLRGPELFKRLATMYRAAFPDVRIVVDDVFAADDKVALRWHAEGTHRGQLDGFAPTGARAYVTGISIDRWKDGKVVEAWNEWDNLGLARAIGAAPPEGSIGEKIGVAIQQLTARWMRKKNMA